MLENRINRAMTINTARYHRSTQILSVFPLGARILIQQAVTKRWDTPGIVVEVGSNRDYIFRTDSGRLFRRNRRLLRQRMVVMSVVIYPTAMTNAVPPVIQTTHQDETQLYNNQNSKLERNNESGPTTIN